MYCYEMQFDFKINATNKRMQRLGERGRVATRTAIQAIMSKFALHFYNQMQKQKEIGAIYDFSCDSNEDTGIFTVAIIDEDKERLNNKKVEMMDEFDDEKMSLKMRAVMAGMRRLSMDKPTFSDIREWG